MANAPRKDIEVLAAHKLIDTRKLLYFYHVAKTSRLTTAEAVLNVAQSAISRQLQQLEQDLGVQLFDRTGRGMTLTYHGRLLFDEAERILQHMTATVDALTEASHAPQVNVSIAAPPSFMSACMGDVIVQFTTMFPDARVRAVEASTGGVYNLLADGDVDLAIVLEPGNRPRIEMRKLVREELLAIAASDHPLSGQLTVSRKTLKDYALVLPASLHGSRSILKRYFDGGGMPLRSNVEVDSLPLMKDLLHRNSLCTILPAIACWNELQSGAFIARPLSPALYRTSYIAHLKEKPLSEAMERLAQCVVSVARQKVAMFDMKALATPQMAGS